MECPVAGTDGNREFLLGLTKAATALDPDDRR
jgi:hypothetical protein